MGLFSNKDNPASAPWHRDGTAVRFAAEFVPVMKRLGLATKARALVDKDGPTYPPLVADIGGAFASAVVEKRDGTWVLEVSVEVEAGLPDGLAVRPRRAMDAAIFDEVPLSDAALARSTLVEAHSGTIAGLWVRRNEPTLARLVGMGGELHEGWLFRSRAPGGDDDSDWIADSIDQLLAVARAFD